ncbi:hypothetical protein [Mesotoga sp.]|uniref:hypothetical protein n=1 Tax=Mesotoga sp. TaxID=2053577 RepID=UPI00345EC703
MSISQPDKLVLESIYRKVLGREKRYFPVDEVVRESDRYPDELNEIVQVLGEKNSLR